MENNEYELKRISELRAVYDHAMIVCDPVEYKFRQQNLLHTIAEYLIQPLQLHELAERSKFSNVSDKSLKKAITKVKNKRENKKNQ